MKSYVEDSGNTSSVMADISTGSLNFHISGSVRCKKVLAMGKYCLF